MNRTPDSVPQANTALKIMSVRREHGKAILFLTNGESFTMPRSLLKERAYKSGMTFDHEAFKQLLNERSYSFAMDKAVSLLSLRARTEKEIVDSLRKNAYPEEVIARVMQRLHEAGYINDAEFAVQFSASRISKGMGAIRIRMDLRMKGIDSQTIDQTICGLDEDDILLSAIKAAKKYAHGKDLSNRADRQKILSALARRGFDFSTAKQALESLNDP